MNPIYLTLIAFCWLLESLPEAVIYTGGYKGWGDKLFGTFRLNYHVPLGLRWLATCIAVTVLFEGRLDWPTVLYGASLVFAYASVEDIGFWLWFNVLQFFESMPEWRWPDERTWITQMFGGIKITEHFSLPNAWWMGLVASYALYWVMR